MEKLTAVECRVIFDVVQRFAMDRAIRADGDFNLYQVDRELFWPLVEFAVQVEKIRGPVDGERFRAMLHEYMVLVDRAASASKSGADVERGG